MAPVHFSRVWRDGVDELIAGNPEFAVDLHSIVRRMNSAESGPAVWDSVVSQPWRQTRRDWYDAAALSEVGGYLEAGWCVALKVPCGHEPGPDHDEVGNNAKLADLCAPFSATFAGGAGDDDGALGWDRPIDVPHDMGEGHRLIARFAPMNVPLEVGRTEPETTIWHLKTDGAVARWPYGSADITVLLTTCPIAGRPVPVPSAEIIEGERRLAAPPLSPAPGW